MDIGGIESKGEMECTTLILDQLEQNKNLIKDKAKRKQERKKEKWETYSKI